MKTHAQSKMLVALTLSFLMVGCGQTFHGQIEINEAVSNRLNIKDTKDGNETLALRSGDAKVTFYNKGFRRPPHIKIQQGAQKVSVLVPESAIGSRIDSVDVTGDEMDQDFDLVGEYRSSGTSTDTRSEIKPCAYSGFCEKCIQHTEEVPHPQGGTMLETNQICEPARYRHDCTGKQAVTFRDTYQGTFFLVRFLQEGTETELARFRSRGSSKRIDSTKISEGACLHPDATY